MLTPIELTHPVGFFFDPIVPRTLLRVLPRAFGNGSMFP